MRATWLAWLLCLGTCDAFAQSTEIEWVSLPSTLPMVMRAAPARATPLRPQVTPDANPAPTCLTDTSQADFAAGSGTNIDDTTNPGSVQLANPTVVNQHNTTLGTSGVGITTTTWGGQTFTPSISGVMTQVDIDLFCSGCTGTTPNLTLSLRATSGGLPTGADLASATVTGFNSGAAVFYTAIFGTPPTLTSGTQYALVIRPTANPSPGTYALTRSGTATAGSDVYAGGTRVAGATSGTVWSIPLTGGVSTDAGFKVYINDGFSASGNYESSTKDAAPNAGATPTWTTLSWDDTTPANTTLQFQAAASNNAAGPFNFVGPDGTASTYFNSGDSLSQFNGFRYLQYQAQLATTDTSVTPSLQDATVCYVDVLDADLEITLTDGVTDAVPGASVTYTITASNAGPADANGASVSDVFPAVETCTWTCIGAGGGTCTAMGGGNINDTVNLPSGTSVIYTASCTIASAATGMLSNTATISAPSGVTDTSSNNSYTDIDTLTPQADLAISNSDGVSNATPGGSVTYTITASNAGPSDSVGATVADSFAAAETCSWTCLASGGGSCTASGTGNINDSVNLPAGSSLTYTANCAISPAATGSLSATASITAPAGETDSNPSNNMFTDTDTLTPQVDLTISNSDGVTDVTPGTSVTYTLVASNSGPSSASGANVVDNFPATETCSWTCSGSNGGSCTSSGSGNLNDSVNLPSGSSVTYSANCSVSLAATGTLSNTATVSAPNGVTDTNPNNNSATDDNPLTAPPGAIVSGTEVVSGSFNAGTAVTYTITLSNSGTGAQADNPGDEFTDTLPAALTYLSSSASSGTAVFAAGVLHWNGAIGVGGSVTITLSATINANASGVISNQGQIFYDSDSSGTNNATAVTNDPDATGTNNPTTFAIRAALAAPVPAPMMDTIAALLLGLLLATLAGLRRRAGGNT